MKSSNEELAKEAEVWDKSKEGGPPPGEGGWINAPWAIPTVASRAKKLLSKLNIKILLIRFAALGPTAMIIADRLGHVLGICIGMH